MEGTPPASASVLSQVMFTVKKHTYHSIREKDNIALRHSTGKLMELMTSSEKSRKEIMSKQSEHLNTLLFTLETSSDIEVLGNCIGALLELSLRSAKRTSKLSQKGAGRSVLVAFVKLGKEEASNPPGIPSTTQSTSATACAAAAAIATASAAVLAANFTPETSREHGKHQLENAYSLCFRLLGRLSMKDRKFAIKARLSGSLPFLVSYFSAHECDNIDKNFQHVFTVLKACAQNTINCGQLGKNGILPIMVGMSRRAKDCRNFVVLKLCLETLSMLVKNKHNASRLHSLVLIPDILDLLTELHVYSSSSENATTSSSSSIGSNHKCGDCKLIILQILKHLSYTKSGRKALTDANVMSKLVLIYQETSDRLSVSPLPEHEDSVSVMLTQTSLVLSKCVPRIKMAIPSEMCPYQYQLPEKATDTVGEKGRSDIERVDDVDEEEDGEEESEEVEADSPLVMNDSDSEPDGADTGLGDDVDVSKMIKKQRESIIQLATSNLLDGYLKFFPELKQLITLMFPNLPVIYQHITGEKVQKSNKDGGFHKVISAPQLKSAATHSKVGMKTSKSDSDKTCPRCYFEALGPGQCSNCTSDELKGIEVESDRMRLEKVGIDTEFSDVYQKMAADTISIVPFMKLAFPDFHHKVKCSKRSVDMQLPDLLEPSVDSYKHILFDDINRVLHSESLMNEVVFDLDGLIQSHIRPGTVTLPACKGNGMLVNKDIDRNSNLHTTPSKLIFESRFECGNLRRATMVRDFEYDLILNPDVNNFHHHQWFYFQVSHMMAGFPYRFNINNCEKAGSQFNHGMQPVVYSVADALDGYPCWQREGTHIVYYRNNLVRRGRGRSYYTLTFTLTFRHNNDVVYIAYHYPYTYTLLQSHLHTYLHSYNTSRIYYTQQLLTKSVTGNDLHVLTVTSQANVNDARTLEDLPYIVLTSRVHPGESNSSWCLNGVIQYLLSNDKDAEMCRRKFVFKIIPMLNPDGVINGNHRCSVSMVDLNRQWVAPDPVLHPEIYHTKSLIQCLKHRLGRNIMVYCDFHGHSRQKNVFMYGCNSKLSWLGENEYTLKTKTSEPDVMKFPNVMSKLVPTFDLFGCGFNVEEVKESTARVVLWREGIGNSYTLESTYCGFSKGKYMGTQVTCEELEETGEYFCRALLHLVTPTLTNKETILTAQDIEQQRLAHAAVIQNKEKKLPPVSKKIEENEEEEEEEEDDDSEQEAL